MAESQPLTTNTPQELWAAPSLLIDATMRIQSANAGAAAMFGHELETLQASHLSVLLADVHELAGRLRERPARVTTLRAEGRRANGVPFPLEIQLTPQPPEGRATLTLRDLNVDGLEAEAKRYFDIAFDVAPIGMALYNSDGQFVRVNESLCRMLGRRPEELLGRRDQELTHPDDRAAEVEAAWRILRGEISTWQTEKRFIHADGRLVWAIANMTFLRDEAGRPLSWVGQFQDITERKRAEAMLRRERDYSAAILGGMHEGFLLVREDRIAIVNDALCRLTGFCREELVGSESPFPFCALPDGEGYPVLREQALEDGRAEAEVPMRRRDGSPFFASVSVSRVERVGEAPLGLVVTVRDITERKRHEERLAHLATYDPLTRLLNRSLFHERLHDEVERARSEDRRLSLVILDLDRFKSVNDTHGHQAGDRVLAEVGRRLAGICRDDEPIGRVGGEEFAWLLLDTGGVAAFAAAERARAAIERMPFSGVGRLTISIGVCELSEATDADELYRLADTALYWAKSHGRNITFRYTPATAAELGADPHLLDAERQFQRRTMFALARTVDSKHPTIEGHSERVGELAQRIALAAGWSSAAAAQLRDAGLVHDVGKVAIPDAILLKAGTLSDLEYVQVQTHAPIGAQMLSHVLSREQVGWVRHHHERWDGSGYPDCLRGEAIPAGAQILALADAWDAMTNARHPRDARTVEAARAEIHRGCGEQFSPVYALALLEVVRAVPAPDSP